MVQDLKSWDEICKKYADVSILRKSFVVLLERRFSYIRNYFLFQILNKDFGFLGISYSLMGIVILLFEDMDFLSILISFSSVVCVVIALYLSPNIRVIQYISVWRKCDNKIMETFSVIVECNGNKEKIQKYEMEIAKLLNDCENELTCDSEQKLSNKQKRNYDIKFLGGV